MRTLTLKRTTVLLLAFGLIFSNLWGQTGQYTRIMAQGILLTDVLEDLGEQYQIFLAYDADLLRNVEVENPDLAEYHSLEQAVNDLLLESGLQYDLVDSKYCVIYKNDRQGARTKKKLERKIRQIEAIQNKGQLSLQRSSSVGEDQLPFRAISRGFASLNAAAIEVTGTVTDSESQPLVGVNILEQRTGNGTITDIDGNYSLSVADENAVLVFSYTGYLPYEEVVGNRQVIDVVMSFDAVGLEEIVVVGYGTQKRSDVTGSIASAKMEEFEDLPNYNVFQALQGSLPGLNVDNPDRPGEDPSILIRGFNSISAGNQPLVVVDGIIYNGSLNNISTNDIASVDVLKDASAAAIYGSRAANGVILITTRTGTSEKPQFNFNTYHGFSNPVKLIDLLDGPGYIQKILDFRAAAGLDVDPDNIESYLTPVETENYRNGETIDWMESTIQTARTHNYHLDVSGRTERSSYYLSGAYFNQEGIVANDNFERMTLKANFMNEITDWLTLKFNTGYTNLDYSGMAARLNNTFGISPYGEYWEDEEQGIYRELPHDDPLGRHPMLDTQYDDVDIRQNLMGLMSANIRIPFIRGLSWTSNYYSNLRTQKTSRFFPAESIDGRTQNGEARKYHQEQVDWTFDNFLTYKREFGGKHAIDATLLYSREFRRVEFSELTGTNFFTQQLGYNDLGIAGVQIIDSDYQDRNSVGWMARLNYVFNDKYALTGTVRRDGYSGFGTENKYATFPSMALSWTVSNEGFMQESGFDLLKLRLSYGENGNQAIDPYQTLARMANSQYVFGTTTVTTLYPNTIANPELGWETTKVFNVGVDFSILRSRLRGSVDVYSSNTYDLLIQRNIPETSGFNSIWTNLGKMHNQGVEIMLTSTNLNGGDQGWNWETGFTFALNRNRIDALTGIDADDDGVEDDDISNQWFIGHPVDVYFGYEVDGIFQLDDEIPSGFSAGEYRLKETDGQEGLSPDDRIILGTPLPNFTFAISNTVRFKGFSLYVLINSIQGGGKENYYMGNNNDYYNVNAPFSTWSERFNVQDVPYWTQDNPTNTYPIINYVPSRGHPVLESRSFVRLQDVSLSYNFNPAVLERLKLVGLRVYASGKNLHTWTNWSGYDPENATTLGGFPMLRTFTFGADLIF